MDSGKVLASGNTADIFLRDGEVVKVLKSAGLESAQFEARKQAYVWSLGVAVPEVIDVTMIDGKAAIVMAHVPGLTMLDMIGDDMDAFTRYLTRSIEIQRGLHAIAAPELPTMRDKLEMQIGAASGLGEELRSNLLAELNDIEPLGRLCHGDFHVQNLIVNADRTTIIDWTDASAGDPRLDVCRSYVLYGSVSPPAAEMYLNEFCSLAGFGREEILRWVPVISAARLSEGLDIKERERLGQILRQ